MKVVVTTEAVLTGAAPSEAHGPPGADHAYMSKYLEVFEEVLVVGRLSRVAPAPGSSPVAGKGVRVLGLPAYEGASGLLASAAAIARLLWPIRAERSAIFLKAPSPISSIVQAVTASQRRPYGVEVVGDPWEVLGPGVVDVPFRRVLRVAATLETRRLCFWAASAAYVTRHSLQRRYPTRPGVHVETVSDVVLPRTDGIPSEGRARPLPGASGAPALLFVGSLARPYKGLDTLLSAVSLLAARGFATHLRVVGEGGHRSVLETQVAGTPLAGSVRFVGALDRDEVAREMREADLFVLPSRTEGLPRVILEALAVGLPCVATRVGGIPELLPREALVERDDPEGLAGRIRAVLESPALRRSLAEKGAEVVRSFDAGTLRERRRRFHETAERVNGFETNSLRKLVSNQGYDRETRGPEALRVGEGSGPWKAGGPRKTEGKLAEAVRSSVGFPPPLENRARKGRGRGEASSGAVSHSFPPPSRVLSVCS